MDDVEHDHSSHAPGEGGHEGEGTSLQGEGEPDEEFLHPWAKEMYRRKMSFNGNERTRLFFGQPDGGFVDLSDLSGADSPLDGRALIAADLDDDMDLDLFVHNIQRERHNVFRNELGDGTGAVKVRLRATSGQHEAIGATVIAHLGERRWAQVLSRGAGYASCLPPELLYGLGDAETIELEVRWPGGALETFGRVSAGARVLLVEGAGEPALFDAIEAALPDPWPDGLERGPGDALPSLRLEDLAGSTVELDFASLAEGEELVLNLWASYCRPCVAELPALAAMHRQPGTRVVGLSLDAPSERERCGRLLDASGADYPSYFVPLSEESDASGLDDLVDLLRLPIPTTIFVGADGRIRRVHQGALVAPR